ncbi:MAG: Glycotrans2-like domain-containing protein [Nitrospira sp.]|nr:MAG: Glycotrans2-like domain-containing protein [Nitrospira sp.]
MDLSIAIISYNTRELLLVCLQSVQDKTADVKYEVIVVDNASRDGSADAVRKRCPRVTVIANAENAGFAKACNQAAAVSSGRYLLLLNSDTVMQAGTLRAMAACLEQHLDIGAVSCLQRNERGQALRSCFPFPSIRDHLRHSEHVPALMKRLAGASSPMDLMRSQDVDWANGACFMIRKAVFDRLGGLDERFFMYFEDVDLCRRVWQLGYRVRHVADAEVVHLLGRSSLTSRARLNVQWELSRICYVEKHFAQPRRLLMKAWIALGVGRKLLAAACSHAADRRQRMETLKAMLRRVWLGHDETNHAPLCPVGLRG